MSQPRYTLDDLKQLMDRLRDPVDGCPWDLDQSYETIAPSTIEEAYEVVDAIEKNDLPALKEELGDLLFQVVFYSRLASEEREFDLDEIIHTLVAKLIRRHPHVFPQGTLESRVGDPVPNNNAEIKASWEAIKQQEREGKGQSGVLDDVPLNLPALSRAQKLQKRAANVGFDWDSFEPVLDKIQEELEELNQAIGSGDKSAVEEEMGDLLFTCVNLSRHLKIDAETALRRSQHKFESRFSSMESSLTEQKRQFSECDQDFLEQLWESAKRSERES